MDTSKVVTEVPRRKLVASGRINRYGQMMRDMFARDDASETPMLRAECGE